MTKVKEVQPEDLPEYRFHKVVGAVKIMLVDRCYVYFEDEDGRQCKVDVGPDFVSKYKPEVGGYLVYYREGYMSYSPAISFENHYVRNNE